MPLLSTADTKALLSDFNYAVLHVNARRLRKNHDSISTLIHLVGHSFSFLCIFEAWIGASDGNEYMIFFLTILNIATASPVATAVKPFSFHLQSSMNEGLI